MEVDHKREQATADHVGARVYVVGYGWGTLHYYGLHATKPGARCGVELDEPRGRNNGTVGEYYYFRCPEGHGLLVSVTYVACR
jgi:dynactin complex subunit